MAATTSNATPRKNGFDFAALSASAGKQDSGDEVARLRAALETLSEMVIAHGVMDARTLESIVGDLIRPPMAPRALSAPLPPPAPSAAEAILKGGVPKPAAVKPTAKAPAIAPRVTAAPARAPIAAAPAPVVAAAASVVAAPAPIVAAPAPAVAAPAPVVAAPAPIVAAPAPIVAAPAPIVVTPAPIVVTPAPEPIPTHIASELTPMSIVVPPSSVQPVVASPFPSAPSAVPQQHQAHQQSHQDQSEPLYQAQPQHQAQPHQAAPVARKNPFDPKDAARLEAELTSSLPPPAARSPGLLSRLFGRPKASPAAVAKSAASVEFTERMPKLPFEGLYSEQQRATELSFPPPSSVQRKPRAAAPAAAKKNAERPAADAAPARFCDRCWRRMDASGSCKTCSPSVSA